MKVVITGGLGFLGQVRWCCGRGVVPCVSHARKRRGFAVSSRSFLHHLHDMMKTEKHCSFRRACVRTLAMMYTLMAGAQALANDVSFWPKCTRAT
jgi:hypothetical protein